MSDKDGLDSVLGQTELEVEAELVKHIEETKELYKKKQAEFNKNYNKANTISLTTKYQMMFVKIEVYLMNFYHIYQNYNYPLVRTAFNRVKMAARQNNVRVAAKTLQIMGRFKRSLRSLQQLEKRKESAAVAQAFILIRDSHFSHVLVEQMRAAKVARVKKLKEQLLDKKAEMEYLNTQLMEFHSKSRTRADVSSGTKLKDQEGKSFELKKLQNKVLKEKERNKKLKASLKATEEKVLTFISDINSMLDSHEDFFVGNDQFNQVWSEFLSNKNFLN